MKDFKFYYKEKAGATEIKDRDFIDEITERINNDSELIESAKENNIQFANDVSELLKNEENKHYLFTMIEKVTKNTPRYSVLKNVEFNGDNYIVEIDDLTRTFCLIAD